MERLSNFNLAEAEVLVFQDDDVKFSREECARSLIGKIFGEKITNLTGLRNALRAIWITDKSFKIYELGPNLY